MVAPVRAGLQWLSLYPFSMLDAFRVNTCMRKRMPKTVNAWIVAAFNKALRENNGAVKLTHCQPYNPSLMR